MAANLGDLVASATLDIAPFLTNTRNLKTYMRGLDNSLKTVENSFRGHGGRVKGLKVIYNDTKGALQGYQSLLNKQTDKFNRLKNEVGDVNKATAEQKKQLLGARTAMLETAAKVTELQQRLRDLATESNVFTRVGNHLQKTGGHMQTFANFVSGVGASLSKGLTAPIVAGSGLVVKAAIDYESAFAGVKKTVDEIVDSNGRAIYSYQDLSSGIRQMSKELPASAVEIANVAEVAGQLGIKTEDVLSFSRTMIDMGESTNLSATDAATAIAKIANITGLTADEYSRFGSSVVALGNNFATTESDIVSMANRLASAGTLVGLTNQEILALATAMSSVGIEAEAGGTAMAQTLTAIEKAVTEAGGRLGDFANVSGMSAEEFSTVWRERPIEAIQAFIKGLSNLGEQGESTTQWLDDLGLKGIRQSNMLKSLALASDTLTGAIDLSNKAWDENAALSDEANKRYETTESKLKMLKNEVTDVAIEFGGPLVDALRDGLQAGKPLIEALGNMAKKFSSLDKEQQQQIIKWGLIAAAAGPVLSIFGKGVGVIGSVVNGLGTASKWLGRVSGGLKATSDVAKMASGASGLGGLGAAATSTASNASLLTSAIGLLGNPVTWGVLLGGAAVAAVGYLGQKALEARQRTEEWGAVVSQTQAKELQDFKDKVDNVNKSFADFGQGGVEQVENVKVAMKGLTDEISRLTDEQLSKDLKLAEKFGLSDAEVQKMKDNANSSKKAVEKMSDEVLNIYKNASENRRKLSDEEKELVLSTQKALVDKQLSLMKFSGKERAAIQKAINGEFNELNTTQLAKALSVTKDWLTEENNAYKKSKSELKKLLEEDKITQETYNREIVELDAEHLAKKEAYAERYISIRAELAKHDNLKGYAEAEKIQQDFIKKEMSELGLSYDELTKRIKGFANATEQSSSMIAKSVKGMSEEVASANLTWNSIVLDPKTGEIKTNVQEEIQKALQAEGGWESLQFVLKQANIETNAKIAIGEALKEAGRWENLSPQEKRLVTDGKPAIEAILSSKRTLETWNSLPEEVKKLLGENEDFLNNAEVAKNALERWNLMTPTEKVLDAKSVVAIMNVDNATESLKKFNGTPAIDKALTVDSKSAVDNTEQATKTVEDYNDTLIPTKKLTTDPLDTVTNTTTATETVKKYNDTPTPQKNLTANSSNVISNTINATNTVKDFNSTSTPTKQLKSNSTSVISGVKDSKGALGQFNNFGISEKELKAEDRTQSGVSSAKANIDSVQGKTVTIRTIFEDIKKTIGLVKGTNFHKGGPAVVNDQKGAVYRELVTLPSGEQFIPQKRDVLLNLPRGSKVLPAFATKRLMKTMGIAHYAEGIGYSRNSPMLRGRKEVEGASNKQNNLHTPTKNTFNFNITVNGNVDDPNEMAELLYRKVEQLMVRERMA